MKIRRLVQTPLGFMLIGLLFNMLAYAGTLFVMGHMFDSSWDDFDKVFIPVNWLASWPVVLLYWSGVRFPRPDSLLFFFTCNMMGWCLLGLLAQWRVKFREKSRWAWWEIMVPTCCMLIGAMILIVLCCQRVDVP